MLQFKVDIKPQPHREQRSNRLNETASHNARTAATSRGREVLSLRSPSFTIHRVCGLRERAHCRQTPSTNSACFALALRSTFATDFCTYSSGSARRISMIGRTASGSTFTMPRRPSLAARRILLFLSLAQRRVWRKTAAEWRLPISTSAVAATSRVCQWSLAARALISRNTAPGSIRPLASSSLMS